jgi:uncharacterized membrane protein
MMIRIELIVLGTVGFLLSLYFTLVYYHLMRADSFSVPEFCRMDQRTCQSLMHTVDAKMFGLPNFLLGCMYYLVIVVTAIGVHIASDDPILGILVVLSLGAVLTSLYLTYSLVWKLRVNCSLCFASHAINIVIFILLLLDR